MTNRTALGDAVRAWAEEQLPGRAGVADRAVWVALSAYEAGASVSEASRRARRYIDCFLGHPANGALRLESSNGDPSGTRRRESAGTWTEFSDVAS